MKRCEKCGGRLIYESMGTFGDLYLMRNEGYIFNQRLKRKHYEHFDRETDLVYCEKCHTQYDFYVDERGRVCLKDAKEGLY